MAPLKSSQNVHAPMCSGHHIGRYVSHMQPQRSLNDLTIESTISPGINQQVL